MTNNDILKADMLDILFEHRNKDYGAYALRRSYNNRLWLSLGIGLSVILLLISLNALRQDNSSAIISDNDKDEKIILKPVDLTPKKEDKPIVKQPEPPKPPPSRPIEKVATIKNTSLVIVKDDEADKIIRTNKDLQDKLTSTVTTDGPKKPGIVMPPNPVPGTGDSSQPVQTSANTEFRPLEREPEYPGGAAALMQFLSRHLSTPSDLENGQKKMVRIRFKVDRDGGISGLEIEQSAGEEYDKEVIRVCKKMPRWKPAIQNGVNVPVSYVLPVTFIGQEY